MHRLTTHEAHDKQGPQFGEYVGLEFNTFVPFFCPSIWHFNHTIDTFEYKRLLVYIKNKENVARKQWDKKDQDVYKGR